MSETTPKRLVVVPDVPSDEQGRTPASQTSKPITPAAADVDRSHGPYSKKPSSQVLLPTERQPMIREVLDGVRLGAYDRHTLDWLCRQLDTPTFIVLIGLMHRARQAAARARKPQTQVVERAQKGGGG